MFFRRINNGIPDPSKNRGARTVFFDDLLTVELIEEKIDDNNYKFSARLEVDYINETYKLDLPEGENYETIGGLIVDETEEIPKVNEKVVIENFVFTILEVSSTKIDVVALKILDEE